MNAPMPANNLFRALQQIAAEQPHATDDQGFPICQCEPCRAKSKRMNDRYIAKMLGRLPSSSRGDTYDGRQMEADGVTEKTL